MLNGTFVECYLNTKPAIPVKMHYVKCILLFKCNKHRPNSVKREELPGIFATDGISSSWLAEGDLEVSKFL